MNLRRSARKQVDMLSSICLERVKIAMKIISKEMRWKVEMRTGNSLTLSIVGWLQEDII